MSEHKKKIISEEIKELANRAVEFVNSTEGQHEIENALLMARKITSELFEARKVDGKKLHDPMTI